MTSFASFASFGRSRLFSSLAIAFVSVPALAIQTCELNGESINPNNGATTAGKSGLMRCRDADSGAVQREQELQAGKFAGVVRYFKAGQVEKEYTVNERGNRNGLSREWNVSDDGKRVLIREETQRDGRTTGIVRNWYPTGSPRRLAFFGDDDREQASVEFTGDGKTSDLHCAARPVFGEAFDDRSACGFGGSPATTVLYAAKGQPAARIVVDRGELRTSETLWESGAVRNEREVTATGGVERSFAADGTKRHETQWVTLAPKSSSSSGARVTTLDQEFHESGKLIHERRWNATEQGADLVSETRWYLNGQPKEKVTHASSDGRRTRQETDYFDNGRVASEGTWLLAEARGDRSSLPTGVHKSFDEEGRERGERVYDARGRLTREREFDQHGALVRDDEVFEDGSRKSAGK